MDVGDFRIKLPTSIIVSGSSQSGKSTLVSKLLHNQDEIFDNGSQGKPKVFIYYSVAQSEYTKLMNAGIVDAIYQGLPSTEDFEKLIRPFKDTGGSIVFFDDLGSSINVKNSPFDFEKLATVFSHHYR
jgi:GTPase SAR1 family protein